MARDCDFARIPHFRSLRGLLPLVWIVLLATALRVPALDRPLLGNFATRNVVYAMIVRNWVAGRADWRYPTLDCLVGGHRSLIMLEMPIAAYVTGWFWSLGGGSLDVWGRSAAVVASAFSAGLLYLLVRRRHGQEAGLGAGTLLAISPVGVIYGQSFMLEPSLVLFTLLTVYGSDRWLEGGRSIWLALSAAALALVILTKIYMLVLLLPLATWVLTTRTPKRLAETTSPTPSCGAGVPPARQSASAPHAQDNAGGNSATHPTARCPADRRKQLITLVVFALAVLPAASWYSHAARTAAPGSPLADRIFYSVRHSAAVHHPPHPVLRSPDFYRQILDDLAGVVLTPVGLMLVLAGLLDPAWRRYRSWLAAMVVLVLLLPLKFYEMNYYWLAVLPPLAILGGLGWQQVRQRLSLGPAAVAMVLLASLLFSLRYSIRPAFVTPPEDRAVVAAGRAVQHMTALEEPIVTMHGTGIDLVYYSDRPAWAVAPETPDLAGALKVCRRQGARYLVFVDTGGPVPAPLAACRRCTQGKGYAVYELPSDSSGEKHAAPDAATNLPADGTASHFPGPHPLVGRPSQADL